MADAAAPETAQSKAKVFISYSRKDIAFADRLDPALKARGFETLIDRTDILAFEPWWQRVEGLIGRADTVVFVLSPDAVRQDSVARKEVAFAASLNKRFAPIVYRSVENKLVPEELAKLNFVFFDEPARFEQSVDQLVEALNTDIGWVRQHTEFGEQARRWTQTKGASGLLLRSPVLEQAERWIASRPPGAPAPTDETQAFIRQSRQGATRRRNILTGSLAAGLVLALALAGLAYWQRGAAVEQRGIAEQRRIGTLAELATSERLRGNLNTALRLGVHAARLALLEEDRAEISAPRTALATTLWQTNWRLMFSHESYVECAAFSPDGTRVVTASFDGTARIWDAASGKEIVVLRGHEGTVDSAAFSPDGTRIITASLYDKTVCIWDAHSGKQIGILRSESAVYSAAYSPDMRFIVTGADGTARVWLAATGDEIWFTPPSAPTARG